MFDRFHVGHQVLIDRLQEAADAVAAITDGQLVGKGLELRQIIQPVEVRARNLRRYLESSELGDKIEVTVIERFDELLEIEGPTTFLMFQGPCCSEIDERGFELRRKRLGSIDTIEYLKPVRAYDGDKVSSARIRLGEIDREGRKLRGTTEPPRRLELGARLGLKTPKGKLFDVRDGPPEERVADRLRREKPIRIIAVGDVTSATLMDQGVEPDVCVVDGITKRGEYKRQVFGTRQYLIYNPPATIYPEAWSAIDTALHDGYHSTVIVEGEEDLLGFPAVLLAPLGSVMLYGQPDRGIVWVPVNDVNKRLARELLEAMPVIL